jgi:hypothetical protein
MRDIGDSLTVGTDRDCCHLGQTDFADQEFIKGRGDIADRFDLQCEGNGVESRRVSLGAVIAMSVMCGVIVAAIGYDRGRALSEGFRLLTRFDEILIGALIRLWR